MKLLLLLLLPFADLYLLIVAGNYIGPHLTIFLVVFTSVLGFLLLRHQSTAGFRLSQASVLRGNTPEKSMFDGLIIVIGAILLMIPGFLSDALGLLTLVPWFRNLLFRRLTRNMVMHYSETTEVTDHQSRRTIEGEYKRED